MIYRSRRPRLPARRRGCCSGSPTSRPRLSRPCRASVVRVLNRRLVDRHARHPSRAVVLDVDAGARHALDGGLVQSQGHGPIEQHPVLVRLGRTGVEAQRRGRNAQDGCEVNEIAETPSTDAAYVCPKITRVLPPMVGTSLRTQAFNRFRCRRWNEDWPGRCQSEPARRRLPNDPAQHQGAPFA